MGHWSGQLNSAYPVSILDRWLLTAGRHQRGSCPVSGWRADPEQLGQEAVTEMPEQALGYVSRMVPSRSSDTKGVSLPPCD